MLDSPPELPWQHACCCSQQVDVIFQDGSAGGHFDADRYTVSGVARSSAKQQRRDFYIHTPEGLKVRSIPELARHLGLLSAPQHPRSELAMPTVRASSRQRLPSRRLVASQLEVLPQQDRCTRRAATSHKQQAPLRPSPSAARSLNRESSCLESQQAQQQATTGHTGCPALGTSKVVLAGAQQQHLQAATESAAHGTGTETVAAENQQQQQASAEPSLSVPRAAASCPGISNRISSQQAVAAETQIEHQQAVSSTPSISKKRQLVREAQDALQGPQPNLRVVETKEMARCAMIKLPID